MKQEHLQLIKDRYENFENGFLKKNPILGKSTPLGFWGATPIEDIFGLFSKLNITKEHSFVDLGSGDGRIVMTASLFSRRTVGVEADMNLNMQAIHIKNELMQLTTDQKLPIHEQIKQKNPFKLASIVEDDFMNHNLSFYDIVYMSPDKPFYRGNIEKKLKNELNGILIVQSMEFFPKSLKQVDEFTINHSKFRIYEN